MFDFGVLCGGFACEYSMWEDFYSLSTLAMNVIKIHTYNKQTSENLI